MFKPRTVMFAILALFAQLQSASIVLAGAPRHLVLRGLQWF